MSLCSQLDEYKEEVAKIEENGRKLGMSDDEIKYLYEASLRFVEEKEKLLQKENNTLAKVVARWIKRIGAIVVIIAVCYGLNTYKPSHNFVERNIQGIIYPVMKMYRRLTLPIVKQFPILTGLYDESCLVENPYFQVSDMECWPCENARVVFNLTGSIENAHVGLPFIMKFPEPSVSLSDIRSLYLSNKELINENAGKIVSNSGWTRIEELFEENLDIAVVNPHAHVTWRINRMEAGRALRNLLKPPRNNQVPRHATSVGIERFLLVDGPTASQYVLPSPEGANVFIKQLSGQRLIVLEPAPECKEMCRRLSILLEERHILWYNWWYWRPRSLPVQNASTISLSFMASSA